MPETSNRLDSDSQPQPPDRRTFLTLVSTVSLSTAALPEVVWARLQEEEALRVNVSMIESAEKLLALEFTPEERELMVKGINDRLESYERLRRVALQNRIPPALDFNPLPAGTPPAPAEAENKEQGTPSSGPPILATERIEELAFRTVAELSERIRSREVNSLDLTRMYLARLRKYDPVLKCVVTLTEDMAQRQARRADEELARGSYRSPLHGVPWGAKDLLAVRGYPTTWGTEPYREQVIDEDATVVRKLEAAGAVLVAKLSLGELAWGDVWFGGQTRTPWDLERGSSGSSAGSAAATAAGLVGFSIGSETWGSIVSPATRCGVTGLRPTFGRVSRHGAMALAWSMDKIGPICRSVEDCALVLEEIRGPDGEDRTTVTHPFSWDPDLDLERLRVGYVAADFESERDDARWRENDRAVLEKLLAMGLQLVRVELPDYPIEALSLILSAEAATAFDELTRRRRDRLMGRQEERAWPNVFRHSRFIPAVEYIQANRVRYLLIEAMARMMKEIDVYLAPTHHGSNLLLTNLTGHPAVAVPNGFNEEEQPTSITFTGRLYGEAKLLALARAYQEATGFHRRQPPLEPA